MSREKRSRQRRRYESQKAIAKQQSIYRIYFPIPNYESKGKWRKSKAMNCGNARCRFCGNPRRIFGRLTIAELKADEAARIEIY